MLKETSEALLEQSIKVTITSHKKAWLRPWKTVPVKQELELKPLTLGTLIKISKEILSIPETIPTGSGMLNVHHSLTANHGDTLIYITAVAFLNKPSQPSKKLLQLIKDNVTPAELLAIFNAITQQMDIASFMSSIILIRGMNLLKEMNPQTQGSTVASGEQLEA